MSGVICSVWVLLLLSRLLFVFLYCFVFFCFFSFKTEPGRGWRGTGKKGGRGGALERGALERGEEQERENSNAKTLFYNDCSLGSVKTCLTNSPCYAIDE